MTTKELRELSEMFAAAANAERERDEARAEVKRLAARVTELETELAGLKAAKPDPAFEGEPTREEVVRKLDQLYDCTDGSQQKRRLAQAEYGLALGRRMAAQARRETAEQAAALASSTTTCALLASLADRIRALGEGGAK